MALYRKSTLTEIVPYEPGLEDGFILGNAYIPKDASTYPIEMHSTIHIGYLAIYDDIIVGYKPYLETLEGKLTIPENGYIATNPDTKERWAMTKDYFEENYIEVTN